MVRRGLADSRTSAQRAIDEDRVAVEGVVRPRAATLVSPSTNLLIRRSEAAWVGRGGEKLAGVLPNLEVDVEGAHCLDVGASTGGFTHVLIESGAATVVALDVGYGQLAWRLRQDPRITTVERTNFRHVEPDAIGAPFDVITVDVSFISIGTIAAQLASCGRPGTDYLLLVKPQFEVGKADVGRGGVVTDSWLHASAIERIADRIADHGMAPLTVLRSPITGAKGNREFFLHARRGADRLLRPDAIERVVTSQ
jgi:23S rRNA (cytidine1920-2'-O)/16S rRNA (cytidine1409-2'-O)-methyltransferase